MNILRITTLWTPFEFWAQQAVPTAWYDLVGPSQQQYVLTGPSAAWQDLVGPAERQYLVVGSTLAPHELEGPSEQQYLVEGNPR